ncbi:MAG: hypothetical protein FWC11_00310 [Firmicutes bacterium]|nr:hypothetical protein [Bacillota bacterium]
MKTNYTLWNGQAVEIEVSEEVAKLLETLELEKENEERKMRWRGESSLDRLQAEIGFEPSGDSCVESEVEKISTRKDLRNAISQLNQKQRKFCGCIILKI